MEKNNIIYKKNYNKYWQIINIVWKLKSIQANFNNSTSFQIQAYLVFTVMFEI